MVHLEIIMDLGNQIIADFRMNSIPLRTSNSFYNLHSISLNHNITIYHLQAQNMWWEWTDKYITKLSNTFY